MGENVKKSCLLLLADAGIEIHLQPGILASAPVAAKIAPEPDLSAIQLDVFVIAFIHFENKVGTAKMLFRMMLTHCHVVGGMIVEVARTEHAPTPSFHSTPSHLKI